MADILFLRGAPAFSAFRLLGLQQRLQAVAPGSSIASAEYWHIAAGSVTLAANNWRRYSRSEQKMKPGVLNVENYS